MYTVLKINVKTDTIVERRTAENLTWAVRYRTQFSQSCLNCKGIILNEQGKVIH